MDLLQLKYIVAIAESDSMTQAAERLRVSQSALSLSYKRLEEELGLRLFYRNGRKLALTEAGTYFCRNASVILGLMDKLAYDMSTIRGGPDKGIVYTSEAGEFTNEARLHYVRWFPEREISELRETTRETLESLRRGRASFAITYEDNTDDFLVSELLLEEPMYAFVNAESPLAAYTALTMEQLRSMPFVCQREEYTVAQIMRRFYTHSSTMPGRIHYVTDPEAMAMSIYNDMGVSFVPESVVGLWTKAEYDIAPGTKRIPMVNKICRRSLYLTYPRAESFPEATAHYMEYIRRFSAITSMLCSFPLRQELLQYLEQVWPEFSAMRL